VACSLRFVHKTVWKPSFFAATFDFMSRTTTFLLVGLGLFVAYQVYRLKAVGNLLFFPGSVTSLGVNGATPEITMSLIAQNTSSVPIEVDSLAGNIYANNTLIGNISSFVPMVIPGNSQTAILVTAQLQTLGIVTDIINAFQNKTFSQNILVKGFANVQGVQVPLDIPMTMGT
jgi:hypothetical protein